MDKHYELVFEGLIRRISRYNQNLDAKLLRKAFEFNYNAHHNQLRKSGEPYFEHPLEVAKILIGLKMDYETIAGGVLHDVAKDADVSIETVEKEFGSNIALLVDGVTKISKIKLLEFEERQAENFCKMLLSMVRDIRVILIKFADRLHNMRTLEYLPEKKRRRIALETREVYAPLAIRLGLDKIKWELEDLSLKHLEPDVYADLNRRINGTRRNREDYIQQVTKTIREALVQAKIQASFEGRPKSFFSIYNKIVVRGIPFEEIYDLLAIRVIVEKIEECYHTLGIIHSLYTPIHERFKDYIVTPKSNGYQSLHTIVIGPGDMRVEIQIRTEQMHRTAEDGIAARLRYKEGKLREDDLYYQYLWLHDVLYGAGNETDYSRIAELTKINLFQDEVFVFTPKGDIHNLPSHSTPVDFAFNIHTVIGLHCQSAKVNGSIVPLNYELKSGDKIEIITSPDQRPNADWLKFAATSKARSNINRWQIKNSNYFKENTDLSNWRKNIFTILTSNVDLDIDTELPNKNTTLISNINEKKDIINLPTYKISHKQQSHIKGEKLEIAVLELFRELFNIAEQDTDYVINKLRRQRKGNQFGHDLSFNATLKDNKSIACHIECKNVSKPISLKDIADKLEMTQASSTKIDHWVLISPYSNPTNVLNEYLSQCQVSRRFSFKIHIWCPETNVMEFFGLNPKIFDFYYKTNSLAGHPKDWTAIERKRVIEKWKLKPYLKLPAELEEYIYNPDLFCFKWENSQEYKILYNNHITPKAIRGKDKILDTSLETNVREWLLDENLQVLFLLGEFGDGKSFFTYLLTRNLINDFIDGQKNSWIPIRFALRNFDTFKNSQDFFENRLSLLGTSLASLIKLKGQGVKFLIILDGFDEMSNRLDSKTINKNIKNLIDCCNEFNDSKILITSRIHFLEKQASVTKLRTRISRSCTLYLSKISDRDIKTYLYNTFNSNEEATNCLSKLSLMHDPIGLASKPLYLQMIKTTIKDINKNKDFNVITLYETYIKKSIMKWKPEFWDDELSVNDPRDIYNIIIKTLEIIAIKLQESKENFISLQEFDFFGTSKICDLLWNMSEPDLTLKKNSDDVKEDVTARFGIRSILTKVASKDASPKWLVDFCHRSIREFFVAKYIFRLLTENNNETKDLLSKLQLNYEVICFIAERIKMSNIFKYNQILLTLIRTTKIQKESTFLGGNIVSLYFHLNAELPGTDWASLNLDYANLSGANLSDKNFQGTSLRYANLDNVIMENAIFSDCDLTGVRLEETSLVISVAYDNVRNKLFAAYAGNIIREWQIQENKKYQSRIISKNEIWHITNIQYIDTCGLFCVAKEGIIFYDFDENDNLKEVIRFRTDSNYRNIIADRDQLLFLKIRNGLESQINLYNIKQVFSTCQIPYTNISLCEKLDDKLFVICENNSDIKILDKSESVLKTSVIFSEPDITTISSLRIANTNSFLVACGRRNGEITLWMINNSATQSCKQIFKKRLHNDKVSCLSFYDNRTLISGGFDRKICILEFKTDTKDRINIKYSLHLTLRCKGLKISGLKSEKEKKILSSIILTSE